MDLTMASATAEILKAGSPWVMLVFMGWYLYRMQEKKDKDVKVIYNRLIDLVEKQTLFLGKVESALDALKKSVENFATKL